MSSFSPQTLIAQADDLRILCVGDIMLDRFVYGAVDRISPEAPIPVMRISREDTMLGGAGNVVRNVLSLGMKAHFCGLVGDDASGKLVASLLAEDENCTCDLLCDPTRPTTQKTRYMASNQQMLRADLEENTEMAAAFEKELAEKVEKALEQSDVMILSDYGKGVLSRAMSLQLIALANAKSIPVIVDPKGNDYSKYRGATLVTPNLKELTEASHMPCQGDEAIVVAARHLIETCEISHVLATRSQDGMTLVAQDGAVHHLPTTAREVFDVSGAGDTVVAALSLALGQGISLAEGAEIANMAAGLVVAKIGTASVSGQELSDAFLGAGINAAKAKVLGRDAAADQVKIWQQAGEKVGFTNGCFDLLHPGHISLIAQARGQCDRLVVALNSDASVKRLKGAERPVQTESARATVLSSLENVDLVVIFEEDTPLDLLGLLLPDVLVKGADYTVDKVVGADLIKKKGGRVFLAQLEDGFSTTNTVAKLKNKT